MLSPIPAPDAFAMFFENNYLSQPHKHSGARTENDLLNLALSHWESRDFEPQRRMYEAQAEKHQARYEEGLREYEMQHQADGQGQRRVIQPKMEVDDGERGGSDGTERSRGEADRQRRQSEREGERAERAEEDVVMENSGGVAVGGFTSING